LKPFDLKKALEGEAVVTRNGRPVAQLTLFDSAIPGPSLVGVIEGRVRSLYANGQVSLNYESDYDLFMAPVKVTRWVNLFTQTGFTGDANHWATQRAADEYANRWTKNRLGDRAFPIEIEE
jgi:hypothetical protein